MKAYELGLRLQYLTLDGQYFDGSLRFVGNCNQMKIVFLSEKILKDAYEVMNNDKDSWLRKKNQK